MVDPIERLQELEKKPPPPNRPQIVIAPGNLKAAAAALEVALMKGPIKLYQQGGKIVEPVKLKGKSFDGTPTTIPGLREVPLAALLEYADSAATFIKEGKRTAREIQPPEGLLKIVLARPGAGHSQLPVLRGQIHVPLVLLDGRVVEAPGYDEKTGVLYEPLGVAFPPLPASPTLADAKAAIEIMWRPFQHYNFRDEIPGTSRSVILAAIFTVLERPMLDAVPLFAVDAPRAGVGKGYLCSAVSQIAIGELPIVTAPGQNYEEEEKILKAIALDHPAIIMIDNVTRPIQGSHIESFITAPTIGIRKFGVLERIKVPNTFVTFYNGNQLQIAADAVRRTVKVSLSTNEEHPEHKHFEFLPHELAAKERPQIVVAALTVIKAFLAVPEEQRPKLTSQMGSFEGWSALARRALVWVGEVDPNRSQESIAAEDPARSRRGRLLAVWEAALIDGWMTTGEFIARATAAGEDGKPLHPALVEALKDVAWNEKDQQISSQRLTGWLKKARDIVIDGRVVRSLYDNHLLQWKWRLQLTEREMAM
jgi:putative DNA primase/helicase